MQETASHLAAELGNTSELDKLWKRAQEKLHREEITRTMLYKDHRGHNAWLRAVFFGKTSLLEKTWEWFKVEFTREELHKELFLDQDNEKKNRHAPGSTEGRNRGNRESMGVG